MHAPIIIQVIEEVNTKVIHSSDEISGMESMGERLKKAREAKDLSQAQLAKKVGLKSQGTIGNIEGNTRGYGARVVAIAEVLGVSPDYLLLKTNDPAPGGHHGTDDETIDLTILTKTEAGLVMIYRELNIDSQKALLAKANDLYKADHQGTRTGGISDPSEPPQTEARRVNAPAPIYILYPHGPGSGKPDWARLRGVCVKDRTFWCSKVDTTTKFGLPPESCGWSFKR